MIPYISISIIALLIVVGILFVILAKARTPRPLSKLGAFAFLFVILGIASGTIAGIFSGPSRLIGYSLMGVGIVLAIVDIIKRAKNKNI